MNRDIISLLTIGGIFALFTVFGIWYSFRIQAKFLQNYSNADRASYYRQLKLWLLIIFSSIMLIFFNFKLALLIGGIGMILHSVLFFNSNVTTNLGALFWARFTGLGKPYILFDRILNLITGVILVILATFMLLHNF